MQALRGRKEHEADHVILISLSFIGFPSEIKLVDAVRKIAEQWRMMSPEQKQVLLTPLGFVGDFLK